MKESEIKKIIRTAKKLYKEMEDYQRANQPKDIMSNVLWLMSDPGYLQRESAWLAIDKIAMDLGLTISY